VECQRCGIQEETKAMQKYATRTGKVWCESCRTPSRRFIKYADGSVCEAWNGDFDEWDNPMKDGQLYLPGERLCNHRDCVSVDHVQGAVSKPERKRGRPAKEIDPDVATVKAILEGRRA
jgi:hypothetical protein